MRLCLCFLFSVFALPIYAGIEVEFVVLPEDDVPELVLQFLPQRVLIGIQDDHVVVRGEYLGTRVSDYSLYPPGYRYWYECRGRDLAVQQPFLGASRIIYTDDPPITIAGLPCQRAIAMINGDSTDIFFTTVFGLDFCQVADIRGFAMRYSKRINGVTVTYHAVKFRPGNLPPDWFDLSARKVIPYKPAQGISAESISKEMLGKKASAFSGTTLDGKKINARALQGKVVALNFWFTDCLPCRQEIPVLNMLASRYREREDVVFLAVALDKEKQIRKFLTERPFLYEIIYNGMLIADRYRIRSYPTNIVINREGLIVEYLVGYAPDVEERLDTAVRQALGVE